MSISVKSGEWGFNANFKSLEEFAKVAKQAEEAVNTHLTKAMGEPLEVLNIPLSLP